MIIYTRIPVSELQTKSDLSWIRATWTVLQCKEDQFGSTQQENRVNGRSNIKNHRRTQRPSLKKQKKHVLEQIDDDQKDNEENDEEININIDQVQKVSSPLHYDECSDNNHVNLSCYQEEGEQEDSYNEEPMENQSETLRESN